MASSVPAIMKTARPSLSSSSRARAGKSGCLIPSPEGSPWAQSGLNVICWRPPFLTFPVRPQNLLQYWPQRIPNVWCPFKAGLLYLSPINPLAYYSLHVRAGNTNSDGKLLPVTLEGVPPWGQCPQDRMICCCERWWQTHSPSGTWGDPRFVLIAVKTGKGRM